MPVYLITYDLKETAKDKENTLLDTIRVGKWKQITKSSYAVVSDKSPTDWKEAIKRVTNDVAVYIISIRKQADGHGPSDVNDWLKENLPAT